MNNNETNEEIIKNDRDLARAMAQVLIERAKAMPEAVEEEEAVLANAPRIIFGPDIVGCGRVSWTIKGVVPKRGIGAIYGPSGSGKTFFVISMMAAIAEGETWYGRRVKKAPVFLAALEGVVGISQRVEAWEVHTGRHFPMGAGVIMNSGLDFASKKSVGFINQDQVLQLLPVSRATPYRYIKPGKLPASIKLGWPALWKVDDIRSWMAKAH